MILKTDPARIRTWNPLIRSQMPYPLGHGALHGETFFFIQIEKSEQQHQH